MHTCRFTVDRGLRIQSWDQTLESLRSRAFPMAAGVPYHMVLPRFWENGEDAIAHVIRADIPLAVQGYAFSCLHESGTLDLSIQPLHGADGAVVGAEVELSSYGGCTVAHKLRRSQALIHVGKFTTTLAHGIRNPLNAIKGAVVYLNEKYNGEPTLVEFISLIEEEIEKLDRFTTRFLSNSFVDIDPSPVDINRLLERVVTLCRLQAYSRDINFVRHYGDVPVVSADSFLIEQAVLNIINNAVEAIKGGGTITIRTSCPCPDGNLVGIQVEDNGPGMPARREEGTEGVHDPEARKGRGFGLFITREIVRVHGGYLEIKSWRNRGTIVVINLPTER